MPGDIILFMTKKWLVLLLVFFLLGNFGMQRSVIAETPQENRLFVAETEELCAGYANCFFNESSDLPESNALTKAINFARDNALTEVTINVLSPYEINSDTITVDYPVSIIGLNGGWISTSNCDSIEPMFSITRQATISYIHLTDGICSNPSRDLIVVSSASPVVIEHSTFEYGKTAVTYQAGAGQLTVQFNNIINNQSAINSTNFEPNAKLLVVANNITSNGTSAQVSCSGNSFVDHNFWGIDVLPSQSVNGCEVDDAKRLDAPIVTETTGVAAQLLSLTNTFPAADFYGFKASSTNTSKLYVVNHGNSAPFAGSAGIPYSCSNYFDVFLPPSANPGAVTLSFTYSDTNDCAPIIQSAAYCGSGNQIRFPLLWYDPKNQLTDKWDKTGDKPQFSDDIWVGQQTTCRVASKTIEVIIDDDGGRPGLLTDMFFTPFVIGYEQAGVLSFSATPLTNTINLNWTTVTEINTQYFYITRSTTSNGTYQKISSDIQATGSPATGSSYSFTDTTPIAGQTYYYQLVVINTDGTVQQIVGPVSALIAPLTTSTSTATATRTPTRTSTHTFTPIYRSPTPFRTATSAFRTGVPEEPTLSLSTATDTSPIEPTLDLSPTPEGTPTPTKTPSLTPSPTVSGTSSSGLLGKSDRYTGEKQVPFYLGGLAVLILIALLGVYIQRKH